MRSLALVLLTIPLAAQHSPEIAEGQRLFRRSCSSCHGDNAKGGRGSDLTATLRHGSTDADIIRNIVQGIPNTQMPAIALSETNARSIVTFLRSLNSSSTAVTGDVEKGGALFFGAGNCSRCHMFAGRGGRLGPDLSDIRNERQPADLLKSLEKPSDSLRRGFETVEVTFLDGRKLTGVRKNEDTYSVQVIDAKENLHLLRKRDLKSVRPTHTSLMPPTNRADAEHLAAFLLKSDRQPSPPPLSTGGVTFNRLRNAAMEPQNWLTYWGDLSGTHFSRLKQITPANVANLKASWSHQFGGTVIETVPIVVDGVMYVTGPQSDVAAIDARTGRVIWRYHRRLPEVASHCTVMTNRGVAVLGDRVYVGTLDAHLVALDSRTGNLIFDVEVASYREGFSITHAPLAIDGKIVIGVTAGECALSGFLDAYDAGNGKRLWRTFTTPQKGDPARATWAGDSADFGGAPTWMTGTYDAGTNTLFWTTGNPGPDYDGTVRAGDNLWSCSVLALDPETGKMKWFFQYTPHDVHDWDANEAPVLIDGVIRGQKRKLLIMANRNAFYYVLDRETGQFLAGKAFARQTWAKGLDDKGHPIVLPNTDPTPEGNYVCPDAGGATNFAAPSYDPIHNLFIVPTREACATYVRTTKPPVPGQGYTGGGQEGNPKVGDPGFIRALDPATGNIKWDYPIQEGSSSAGVLSTAGGVVFAATRDGHLIALESGTGRYLWHFYTGAEIKSSPMSFAIDGKQFIAVASSSALFVFGM